MIQPEIIPLTEQLRAAGLHITIETAGTVFQPVACDLMSISPKLANSTPEGPWAERHDRLRLQPGVLSDLMCRYDYQLKFVIAKPEDLGEVPRIGVNPRRRPRARHPRCPKAQTPRRSASAGSGWRKSAKRKASALVPACMWTYGGTGEGCDSMHLETERLILATWEGCVLERVPSDRDGRRGDALYRTAVCPLRASEDNFKSFISRQVRLYETRGFCRWNAHKRSRGGRPAGLLRASACGAMAWIPRLDGGWAAGGGGAVWPQKPRRRRCTMPSNGFSSSAWFRSRSPPYGLPPASCRSSG